MVAGFKLENAQERPCPIKSNLDGVKIICYKMKN